MSFCSYGFHAQVNKDKPAGGNDESQAFKRTDQRSKRLTFGKILSFLDASTKECKLPSSLGYTLGFVNSVLDGGDFNSLNS